MSGNRKLTLIILATLFVTTLVFGGVGWTKFVDDTGRGLLPGDILYRTILAFMGDGVYLNDLDRDSPSAFWLLWARVLGLLTTISALLGIGLVFLGEQIKRMIAARRTRGQVVVGASDFAVDYAAARGRAVVFDTENALARLTPRAAPFGTLWIRERIGPDTFQRRSFGRVPATVIFGDRDSTTNVERALLWVSTVKPRHLKRTTLVLRIEDNSVARDLSLLSNDLAQAELISRSESIARSLVTVLAPTALAKLRGQREVHVALFGLGSTNLAIAEELVLRCHHSEQTRLNLTIADQNKDAAIARLRKERPDLLNEDLAKGGLKLRWVALDGQQVCAPEHADTLCNIEAEVPLTAIIVSAGSDARNIGIAMRLRQMQKDRLLLRAPILMRSDAQTSIAPEPLVSFTDGIVPFGGRVLDDEDNALEAIYRALAETIHNTWRESPDVEKTQDNRWENLSTLYRRSSFRAALSTVEIFYAAGFVPPVESNLAGLRLHPSCIAFVKDDPVQLARLSDAEHDRWNAERRAEGHRGRKHKIVDREKKLHPLIVSNRDLPDDQKVKDRKIVEKAVDIGLRRFRANTDVPSWRRSLRVGVVGPLVTDPSSLDGLHRAFAEVYEAQPLWAFQERALEILTPNAPGFDREAATRLLKSWRSFSGRPARVLTMDVARLPLVDKIAAEWIAARQHGIPLDKLPTDARKALLQDLEDQTEALEDAAGGRLRSMDLRPLGVSDTDLDIDRALYFQTVHDVQDHMMRLADMMIFDTRGRDTGWTAEARRRWKATGKPMLHTG